MSDRTAREIMSALVRIEARLGTVERAIQTLRDYQREIHSEMKSNYLGYEGWAREMTSTLLGTPD